MRFKDIVKKTFIDGDKVQKSGFMLLPKTIGQETRWLEFGKWIAEYKKVRWSKAGYKYVWEPIQWLEINQEYRDGKIVKLMIRG